MSEQVPQNESPSPFGQQPSFGAPPFGGLSTDSPKRPQKRRFSFFSGLLMLMLLGAIGLIFIMGIFVVGDSVMPNWRASIAIMELKGSIMEADAAQMAFDRIRNDPSIKAVVLRIDSPGGAVGASQEIYEEVRRLSQEDKIPVVVSMGNTAASGGYYVACASDYIIANPGTLTGSIGVILTLPSGEQLARKLGVEVETITSGKFKDTGSLWKTIGEDQKALLQTAVNDTYEQFFEAVIAGRMEQIRQRLTAQETPNAEAPEATDEAVAASVTDDAVRAFLRTEIADGRVLTGNQAFEAGLVDQLGPLNDAIVKAIELADLAETPVIRRIKREPSLFDLLGAEASALTRQLKPGMMLEYRLHF